MTDNNSIPVPVKPLKDRTDEELYALVEKQLSGPPFYVDREAAPERSEDPDGEAYVLVHVGVTADDFPAEHGAPPEGA